MKIAKIVYSILPTLSSLFFFSGKNHASFLFPTHTMAVSADLLKKEVRRMEHETDLEDWIFKDEQTHISER